jgi:hypothetical protein
MGASIWNSIWTFHIIRIFVCNADTQDTLRVRNRSTLKSSIPLTRARRHASTTLLHESLRSRTNVNDLNEAVLTLVQPIPSLCAPLFSVHNRSAGSNCYRSVRLRSPNCARFLVKHEHPISRSCPNNALITWPTRASGALHCLHAISANGSS